MRCIIIGASALNDYEYYKSLIKKDDYIICADGGLLHLKKLGITPDIIIGDFDSSNPPDEFENKIFYPSEKDDTDTLLCLKYAIKRKFKNVIIIGGLSGRIDHSISNIHILKYGIDKSCHVELIDENTRIFLIDKEITVKNENYKYISVFPLGDKVTGLTFTGLKYPLYDYTLETGIPLGVSNQFIDDYATIKLKSGYLLVILIS